MRCDGANEAAAEHQKSSETGPAARHDNHCDGAGPPSPQVPAFVGTIDDAVCAGGGAACLSGAKKAELPPAWAGPAPPADDGSHTLHSPQHIW
jgi:hypothetical protein